MSVPLRQLLGILLLDIGLVLTLSFLLATVVARAGFARRPAAYGVALLAPVVGPTIMGVAGLVRANGRLTPGRSTRGILVIQAGILLLLAGVVFAAASFLRWGRAVGSVESEWALTGSAAPADTVVGLFATFGTALLLGVAGLGVLFWDVRGRTASVVATSGVLWLLITTNSLLLISAANTLAGDVRGLSGGHAGGHLIAGGSIWACTVGAVLAVVAAVLLICAAGGGTTSVTRPATGQPVDAWAAGTGSEWPMPTTTASPQARIGDDEW